MHASSRLAVGSFVVVAIGASSVACSDVVPQDDDAPVDATGTAPEALDGFVSFVSFDDAAPVTLPARAVITSLASYVALTGHPPPITIDWAREWVVFYGAGTKPTGGYAATIERLGVSWWGPTLLVETKLVSPGADCIVTKALTNPQAFAKLSRPAPRPYLVHWTNRHEARSCDPAKGR